MFDMPYLSIPSPSLAEALEKLFGTKSAAMILVRNELADKLRTDLEEAKYKVKLLKNCFCADDEREGLSIIDVDSKTDLKQLKLWLRTWQP